MVQRTEHPRQFVGVKVGGGLGDRDTQTRGDRGEAGRHQAGIEGGRGLGAASERFGLITPEPVGSGEQVGEEGEVELPTLQDAADPVIVISAEIVCLRTGVTPRGVRMGDR